MLHLVYVLALIWFSPMGTFTMLNDLLHGTSVSYKPINFDQQGLQIKLAVLASEDQKFPSHYGVDVGAIKSAIENNAKGKKIRGGSTISQQTAKNIFLWQGRSWIRKGLEAYTTLIIEFVWGKKRILEHYLNIAEMGQGIYGIKAAAMHYYNTTPEKLTASQAAWIAASLPNPKEMNPDKKTPRFIKKQKWILKQMNNLKGFKGVKKVIAN